MSQINHIATFTSSDETAIYWIKQRLTALGLVVRPSFDFQVAKSAHSDCTCLHHGTEHCDCQVVILLVYGEQDAPISLVVQSQDGKTYLSMMESLNTGEEGILRGKIITALGYQKINIL